MQKNKVSYYERHKERIREYVKHYYALHKSEIKANKQKWEKEHPQEYKQKKRADYEKYRIWYLEYHRKRREKELAEAKRREQERRDKLGNACMVCGYCEHPEILIIHHIDHDRENNSRDNLLLVCPNCHHLLHNSRRMPPLKRGKS
jgi:hypothetical protein